MLYPNPNMLLYIGIADAFAKSVEYVDWEENRELFKEVLAFKKYCKHPKYKLEAWQYTDDTEMSVANALVLIENDAPYTPLMFVNAWLREFVRGGKRQGYSRGFQKFLENVKTSEEFLANINPYSFQNGAAMRAVPIGILPTVAEVLDVATLQASITHNTPCGLFSARAVALMSHFALYIPLPFHCHLEEYCLDNLPAEDIKSFGHVFRTRWDGGEVKATKRWPVAVNTVHAVVDTVVSYGCFSLKVILEEVIKLGGDTDSVASIALGIVGSRTDLSQIELPPFMFVNLENGNPDTGSKYLLDVGTKLMDKFSSRPSTAYIGAWVKS